MWHQRVTLLSTRGRAPGTCRIRRWSNHLQGNVGGWRHRCASGGSSEDIRLHGATPMDGRVSPIERPAGQHAAKDILGKRLEVPKAGELIPLAKQRAQRGSPVGRRRTRVVISQSFQDTTRRTHPSTSMLRSATAASSVCRVSREATVFQNLSVRCGRPSPGKYAASAAHTRVLAVSCETVM